MKKKYIAPHIEEYTVTISNLLENQSEEEWSEWFGAKENDGLFDDFESFGSLWDDDPVEDPFAIGD